MNHWLPRKYYPPFQKGANNTGESFKTIEELHEFDYHKTLYKQFRRIEL